MWYGYNDNEILDIVHIQSSALHEAIGSVSVDDLPFNGFREEISNTVLKLLKLFRFWKSACKKYKKIKTRKEKMKHINTMILYNYYF